MNDYDDEFIEVFNELRKIYAKYIKKLIATIDREDKLYLNTKFIMKNNQPMYFGGLDIKKNYVSFHLMPIYVFPELLDSISPDLKKRMQGKSCFNFKIIDKDLFKELKTLVDTSYKKFVDEGYI